MSTRPHGLSYLSAIVPLTAQRKAVRIERAPLQQVKQHGRPFATSALGPAIHRCVCWCIFAFRIRAMTGDWPALVVFFLPNFENCSYEVCLSSATTKIDKTPCHSMQCAAYIPALAALTSARRRSASLPSVDPAWLGRVVRADVP